MHSTSGKILTLVLLFGAMGASAFWYLSHREPAVELPEAVAWQEVQEQEEAEETVNIGMPEVETGVDETEVVIEEAGEEDVLEQEETSEAQTKPILEADTFPSEVNLAVPFTPQAPHANWDLPYQEACEEASVYMVAQYFAGRGEGLIEADEADASLQMLVEDQQDLFGYYEDTTAEETATFAEQLPEIARAEVLEDPTIDALKEHLASGRPVIVPAAGKQLGNPYFSGEGPLYHMLVLRGYTDTHFITNDPGTRRGEAYLYEFAIIMNAMRDWNGGEVESGGRRVIILYPHID